jgi:hypothetical protein
MINTEGSTKPKPQQIELTQKQDTMTQPHNDMTNTERKKEEKEGMDIDQREQDKNNIHNTTEHQRGRGGEGEVHREIETNEVHKDRKMTKMEVNEIQEGVTEKVSETPERGGNTVHKDKTQHGKAWSDDGTEETSEQSNIKRTKKLRTERDKYTSIERTWSKTRVAKPTLHTNTQ